MLVGWSGYASIFSKLRYFHLGQRRHSGRLFVFESINWVVGKVRSTCVTLPFFCWKPRMLYFQSVNPIGIDKEWPWKPHWRCHMCSSPDPSTDLDLYSFRRATGWPAVATTIACVTERFRRRKRAWLCIGRVA